MAAKKILQSSITGQQGIALIQQIVLGMGFVWHETGGVEAGIDGFIEIRNTVTGEMTNSILQVQSKATKGQFRAETSTSFEYLCNARDLDYWLQGNAPVILVVSRPDSDEAYWVSIKEYFRDPEKRRTRKVYFDKRRDRLDETCKVALVTLAVPKDAGVYFAPPPAEELLYSNLLRVAHFPENFYIAQTEYRYGREIRAKVRDFGAKGMDEWFSKSKSVLSFNDLGEGPWEEICDQGTLETFDSEEWAYSDDPDEQRDFVRLLNQCLRAKVYGLGLRYSKDRDCYYFKATDDLSDYKLPYQSIASETSRLVFRGYSNKKDPKKTAYYRHSAFEGRFKRFDDAWYLEITPTYYFTWNGYRPDKYYEDRLKGIKQLEKNAAVRGQVVMWADFLSKEGDLLTSEYPLLKFDELMKFVVEAGIDDEGWLARDEEPEKDVCPLNGPVLFEE